MSCRTKAQMKELPDSCSCPITPDEDTCELISKRRTVGVFSGQKCRYKKWRTRFLAHLKNLKLLDTLERTPPEEPFAGQVDVSAKKRATRQELYQQRCERDCAAIDEFCTTIEGPAMQAVANCTYAKELLDTLDRIYLTDRR